MIDIKLYRQVLSSKRWKQLKQEKGILHNYCCERCGVSKYSYPLELHHKHYDNLGKERHNDVELLCPKCHKKADYERISKKNKLMDRTEFLAEWSIKKNINPLDISEQQLKDKYAEYLNWFYQKRMKDYARR